MAEVWTSAVQHDPEVPASVMAPFDGLRSERVKVRLASIEELATGRADDEVVSALADVLHNDSNENVRSAAAKALGTLGGPRSLEILHSAAIDARQPLFIRRSSIRSLGAMGSPAASLLGRILTDGAEDQEVRSAAMGALEFINDDTAASHVSAGLRTLKEDELAARAVSFLANHEVTPDVVEHIESLTAPATPPKTRGAAINALRRLSGPRALTVLAALLSGGEDEKTRRRAVLQLSHLGSSGLDALISTILFDPSREVRMLAADAVGRCQSDAILEGFLRLVDDSRQPPHNLDQAALVAALRPLTAAGDQALEAACTRVLDVAVGRKRPWPFLGQFMTILCGGSARAGDQVDKYEGEHPSTAGALQWLRIEIGGEVALDPLLDRLREDLRVYFQVPVHQLNEETRANWSGTLRSARQAFTIRVWMSILVFASGMVVVGASLWMFFTDRSTGSELWGPGVSMAAGLGAMFLVIYSGPLKDIQAATSDLAASNIVFIAYVHRVLQISHIFSARYLKDELSLQDVGETSALIQSAMQSSLRGLLKESVDHKPADREVEGDERRLPGPSMS